MLTFIFLASLYTMDTVRSHQSFEKQHYMSLTSEEKHERLSWFIQVSLCLSDQSHPNIDCKTMFDTSGWKKNYYDFGLLQNFLI